MSAPANSTEKVVLIHGWISHTLLMKPLEWRFQRAGYATCNWGYRSLRGSIAEHASAFAKFLSEVDQTQNAVPFHVVAHSMGSIVTRTVLQQHAFKNLGRVVMLCPPNRGSHMARRASALLGGRLRTLSEISDALDSYVNQLPLYVQSQIGIVIASGDRVIVEPATRLENATDYVTVPGMHNSVLFKQRVADLCVQFLKNGRFSEV